MYKAIIHANIVTYNGIIYDGAIIIKGKKIFDIQKDCAKIPADAQVIDAQGAYVGPGFVDLHVHASRDCATYDESARAAEHFLKHGTTTLLSTPFYVQPLDQMLRAIADTKKAMQKSRVIKGIYMEGPYTNPVYGANSDKNPWRHGIVEEEYKALVDACGTDVKVWTVAPELAGIEGFFEYARKVNPDVVFAIGHSEATPLQIASMYRYPPKLMTHTTNATGRLPAALGTRGVGPDEYCFSQPDMYAELISDSHGIHVNPAMQQMLMRIKGVDRIVLVTDATLEGEPSPAQYAHITDLNFDDHGGINGSLLTMDVACRNIMSHTNCGIAQAFIMASLNPAKVIGMDHEIGSIEKGKLADLVFVNDKFDVLNVMTEGDLYE